MVARDPGGYRPDRGAEPRIVEGTMPAARLRPGIAAELGLPPGIPLAGGAGDAAAGAIGIGAIDDGDGFVSLGTSAQYFVTTATYRPYPERLIHAYCHGLPERWFQSAALLNGASCVGWAARLLGEPDIPALLARVEAAWRGPSRILFLPYLAGERTPHDDPHARGVLFGLDADSCATDVAQAVMEGVAFSLAEAQDCLAEAGTDVQRPLPSAAARAARSGCACSLPSSTARSRSMPVPRRAPPLAPPASPGWRHRRAGGECAGSPRSRPCWNRSATSWTPTPSAGSASAASIARYGRNSPLGGPSNCAMARVMNAASASQALEEAARSALDGRRVLQQVLRRDAARKLLEQAELVAQRLQGLRVAGQLGRELADVAGELTALVSVPLRSKRIDGASNGP